MENNEENGLYAVMRLNTKIQIGKTAVIELDNLEGYAGYIPVFDNYEKAHESSEDGKFKVVKMEILNNKD